MIISLSDICHLSKKGLVGVVDVCPCSLLCQHILFHKVALGRKEDVLETPLPLSAKSLNKLDYSKCSPYNLLS